MNHYNSTDMTPMGEVPFCLRKVEVINSMLKGTNEHHNGHMGQQNSN